MLGARSMLLSIGWEVEPFMPCSAFFYIYRGSIASLSVALIDYTR